MSGTQPDSTENMLQIQRAVQQHQEQLTEELQRAGGLMQAGRAQEACAAFAQALQTVDTFYSAWEERLLSGMMDWWRESIAQEKAEVLWGLGQATSLIGKLDEAQLSFQRGLSLLPSKSHAMRAMLLEATASLCVRQGSFDDAERLYRAACNEYASLGMWQQYCMALTSLADSAYARGDRARFLQYLDEAIEASQAHTLPLERYLQLKKFRFRISTDPTGETLQTIKQARDQLRSLSQDPDFQIDVNLLLAEFSYQRDDLDSAEEAYNEALAAAQANPSKQWSILLSLADLHERRGKITQAVESAGRALTITRTLGMQEPIARALQKLIALRILSHDPAQHAQAAREMDELRAMGRTQELTLALLTQALSLYESKRFESAQAALVEAEEIAPTLELRQRSLLAQAATLQATGRWEAALAANLKSIELLNELQRSTTAESFAQWTDWLRDFAGLHENAAVLTSRLGRPRDAFRWAEAGRAQVLRRQLEEAGSQAQTDAGQTSDEDLDELRAWLANERAALVLFCVRERDSMALVVDPVRPEPQPVFLDLSARELKRLLPPGSAGTPAVFNAVPVLSSRLMPTLRGVIDHCRVLYVVPESDLYSIPFAALAFNDGTRLVEHCALAYVPSATVLKWCRLRHVESVRRTCLAAGVGKAEEYSFADQARAIAAQPQWTEARVLADATVEKFLREARRYDVVHLSCHGSAEPSILDTLSSSRLQFADRALTAKEILLETPLRAQLVFLNACMSGEFHSGLGGEVGGFWQAFLARCTASLVATLAYVHPRYAQQLALDFYREWLGGRVTKAEALRRAQLGMLRQNVEPRHWACHILIGEHR